MTLSQAYDLPTPDYVLFFVEHANRYVHTVIPLNRHVILLYWWSQCNCFAEQYASSANIEYILFTDSGGLTAMW